LSYVLCCVSYGFYEPISPDSAWSMADRLVGLARGRLVGLGACCGAPRRGAPRGATTSQDTQQRRPLRTRVAERRRDAVEEDRNEDHTEAGLDTLWDVDGRQGCRDLLTKTVGAADTGDDRHRQCEHDD